MKHGICLARWAGVARGTTASSEVQRVRVCVPVCVCVCVCVLAQWLLLRNSGDELLGVHN